MSFSEACLSSPRSCGRLALNLVLRFEVKVGKGIYFIEIFCASYEL
jgi:hypothetical protein